MKERKWWNSVSRVPSSWWRFSSTASNQEPESQTSQHREESRNEEDVSTKDCSEPETLSELTEGKTPDEPEIIETTENVGGLSNGDAELRQDDGNSEEPDDRGTGNSRRSSEVSARESLKNIRNLTSRSMSTPPRRRKEFVVEGIPNISFSFFNEQAGSARAMSETCVQEINAAREAESPPLHTPVMDTPSVNLVTPVTADRNPAPVAENVKTLEEDYEVLKIPINSTPMDAARRSSDAMSQEPSKKSSNISCINILSLKKVALQDNMYASPRNSSTLMEATCADLVASFQSAPPFLDHGTTSCDQPDLFPSNCNISPVQDAPNTSSPSPGSSSPVCTTLSFHFSATDSLTDAPSLFTSLSQGSVSPYQDRLTTSTMTHPSSITISLPLELRDQSSCQDWETITDCSLVQDSDYYDLTTIGSQRQVNDGDYEDVQTRQELYPEDSRQRRATLMRDRRRRLGTVRIRIRRAWRAVRGWWGQEKGRIENVIQRHAHAQAVRQDGGAQDARDETSVKTVALRKRCGERREGSRVSSQVGLRRSRHYPEGQNGFEELRRYIKQGGDFCKDLSSILQERSEAETQYAKSLSKLSGKLMKASKDSVGTVNHAWQCAGAQMEAQSEIHRAFATALNEEVVKPLRQMMEAQHRIRKSVEAAVDKTGKSLNEWRSAEGKSKKQSFLCARENEKMQDAMLDVRLGRATSASHLNLAVTGQQQASKDKESAKLESKRRKAEEAVKKADVEYYTFSMRAERARLEWETAVIRGSHCFQALEEERLQQLKHLAACYLNHLHEMGPKTVQSMEQLQEPVEICDVTRDIQTVVSIKGTGQPIPEQLLPDFYAEHITLAMNRDRRRQALMKLLQLIRQDLDRERRGKQGVENLARALQQTPTFGAEDSQQNVTEKLHHMRSMLTYLEAMRYKVQSALAELDGRARGGHPLAAHIQVTRDRQGLQQSVLKVPPWVREESLDRLAGDSPDWTDRGTADGNSVQPDSDFDEFSSQESEKDYQSSVLTQCPVISECATAATAPSLDTAPSIRQCRALYEYTANLYDELNLQPGDVIKIHDKQADGWWLGELNGVVGIFPATYVQEMN